MTALVTYSLDGAIATITLDDGKRNALSPALLAELHLALARAKQDRAVVLLSGREGVLSAGFDLTVLKGGGKTAADLLRSGFEVAQTLLSLPTPVVIACSGHAMAMGAFLLLSGDYRIGAAGPFKISVNEVAIGMTLPRSAIEICRQRLTPAHFNRATLLAEVYDPESALAAGFLDRVVPAAQLQESARTLAGELAKLSQHAHAATKLRVRAQALQAIRLAFDADSAEFEGAA